MRYLFLFAVLGWQTLAFAQSESSAVNQNSPVFAHLGIGGFPALPPLSAEFSVAAGYRINRNLGVGVEYRATEVSNESVSDNANLIGMHLRGQLNNGWHASLGGGAVLSAFLGSDGPISYEYNSGGNYLSFDLGYQFRWGLTIGLYVTSVNGHTHDVLEFDNGTNTSEPTGQTITDSFAGLGIKVGYGFPRR